MSFKKKLNFPGHVPLGIDYTTKPSLNLIGIINCYIHITFINNARGLTFSPSSLRDSFVLRGYSLQFALCANIVAISFCFIGLHIVRILLGEIGVSVGNQ